MFAKVRRLFHRDNLSISEIQRRTSLSRNTIKVWLKETRPDMRIPAQSCHPFQTNAATHSILKLPLIPVNVATPWWWCFSVLTRDN
jgi:hypothetical protein